MGMSRFRVARRSGIALAAMGATMVLFGGSTLANVAVTQIGADPYTNATSQHAT